MEASIGVNLRVTAHSNQGGRKYMEDMFCVAYQPTSDERDLLYSYFGIFDGHGGREAAMYAKTHLMDHIVTQKNFWSEDDELVKRAIHDGFISVHHAMWKEYEQWPKTASGLPSTSGTTASIVFVRRGKMYIGHVGDSAIVLGVQDPGSQYWRGEQLTRDHKPESTQEIARIQRSGGKVVCKSGVPRVVWNRPRIGHKGPVRRSTHIDEIPFLAVARSLGDLWSYNYINDEFVVSPEPDVMVIDIDVKTHRCIILGSDGLWNMINAQEAVNSVFYAEKNNERQLLQSPPEVSSAQVKNWINPSKRLVDKALERWLNHNLRADNTSVVTVVIDPPGPPKAQVIRQKKEYTVRQTHSAMLVDPIVEAETDEPAPKPPSVVLNTSSGQKTCISASSSSDDLTNESRIHCTPVSRLTNHKVYTNGSTRLHALVTEKTSRSSPTTPLPEKHKPSSTYDSRTKRVLVKRNTSSTNEESCNTHRTSTSSTPIPVSSTSIPETADPSVGPVKRDRHAHSAAEKAHTSLRSKANDDVQIHEISSSSEDRSPQSTNISNDTPSNKRRKLHEKDKVGQALRVTRNSTSRGTKVDSLSKVETPPTSKLRRAAASAPPIAHKAVSRTKVSAKVPERRSLQLNTKVRSKFRPGIAKYQATPVRSDSPQRELRSIARQKVRVTRSMKSPK